jgi:uncharacterized protein (TIGR00369 family)
MGDGDESGERAATAPRGGRVAARVEGGVVSGRPDGHGGVGAPSPDVDVTVAEVTAFAAEHMPFCARFGIVCDDLGRDLAVARWRHSPDWTRPVDVVSGPVLMALADVAIYWAIFTRGGISPFALTNELHTTFLRPAVSGRDVLAVGRIVKRGRKVVYGTADLFEEGDPGRLVAQATSTYVVADGWTEPG